MKTAPEKVKPLGKRALKSNIGKGFTDNIGRLAKMISKGKRNEDETRRWVIDILKQGFGYTDDDIETECRALGQRVDIALVDNEKIFAVIECKAVNVEIKQNAINQAANYATSLGVDWAIVTNGQMWSLYHVGAGKKNLPDVFEVFTVELLDEDGISKDDITLLYLLTKKSLLSGETEDFFFETRLYDENNILKAILSDSVAKAVTKELIKNYKNEHGIEFEGVEVEHIKELLKLHLEDLIEE